MMKNVLCRASLFSIGTTVSLALSGLANASGNPVDELISSLSDYGISLSDDSIRYSGASVYKQEAIKSEGKIGSNSVKHGTYKHQELDIYSQDPMRATVNGKPFLDYVMDAHDVSDKGPLFTINSEMVLCWFIDESILFEVEDIRIKQYIKDQGMDYNNRCINNEILGDYWRGSDRDTHIR